MPNTISPFDRVLLRRRLDRAASMKTDARFLRDHSAADLADRLRDVKRNFGTAALIACTAGELFESPPSRIVEAWPSAQLALARNAVAIDEELLPFVPGVFDLVVSNLTLQWVNDLPGALLQIRAALRPDGLFLAAMTGGETLWELRHALLQAESEMTGGAAPRVSPMADPRDLGSLLQRAGFLLPVVDSEKITVTYPNVFALVRDLRGMGASAAFSGAAKPLTRGVVARTAELYQEKCAENGRLRATFEIIHMSGWAAASVAVK